ncbi:MAG: tellurite-like stress resistance cysteine protease StiP, partial [Janthinobacterium sp.]
MTDSTQHFSGSYRQEDVEFLLTPMALEPILDLAEKERLIQSGQRHYSEMLSPESLPSPAYLALFQSAFAANRLQMARDCLRLAALIAARRAGPVTLVSLARAGTPVGVILGHLLRQVFQRECRHYSVSIIRDRGIDANALKHILAQGHAPESIVFVDGWTGKGVISRELRQTVHDFNAAHGTATDGGLFVLSDLAGTAACAASASDYLIPSSILNATVSGLVSRSVLNDAIGPGDFHGCVYYAQFEPHD